MLQFSPSDPPLLRKQRRSLAWPPPYVSCCRRHDQKRGYHERVGGRKRVAARLPGSYAGMGPEVKVEADHLTFHEKPGSHLQARPCGRSWHRARTLQNSLQATKVWGRLSSLSLLRQASLKKTGARDINAAIQPIHKLQAEAPRDRLGKLGRVHRRLHPQSFAQIVAVLDGVTVEEAVCGLCGAKIKAHRAVPDQALRDAIFGAQSSESLVARKLEADQSILHPEL